jgi:hypothetical protein
MKPLATRSLKTFLVLLVLAGAGAIAAGQAKADFQISLNPCLAVAPDATRWLSANTPQVEAVSNGSSYTEGMCIRFVTDVRVPASSSGGPWTLDSFTLGGGYADVKTGPTWEIPLSESDCSLYQGDVRVYKKNLSSGAFEFKGGGSLHSAWSSGEPFTHCRMVRDYGFVDIPDFEPPAVFTDTYRVIVGARIGGTWKQVDSSAWHLPFIP